MPSCGHTADHTVNLTGELKGDTTRVSRIEMPTPQVRHHHVADG
jgi:hypothetical protein